MSRTMTENFALLRQHVRALEERAAAAEGKLDIIKRRLEGEPDDSLAIDYGGTQWEEDPTVLAVDELMTVALTVRGMYFSRLRKYMRLRAQTGLLQMQRVQIEDPIHLYEMKGW